MQKDAAFGAGAGGLLGLVAGVVVTPLAKGETTFLLGPIIVTAGIVGAFLGGMVGWGVHSNRLESYERKVKAGQTLLMAHGNPWQVAKAHRILLETHPAELHMHAETSADAHEIHPDK